MYFNKKALYIESLCEVEERFQICLVCFIHPVFLYIYIKKILGTWGGCPRNDGDLLSVIDRF